MKNQNGITVTMLVLTIVVFAIIVGTITFSSISSLQMRVYYNMCSDIEILDEKIALYYLQNKELPVLADNSKDINDLIAEYNENNVNYNPNNSGNLKKIDLSKLDNLSLNYTDYYIDETSHTIYLLNGITLKEETYFTVPINYEKVELNNYR